MMISFRVFSAAAPVNNQVLRFTSPHCSGKVIIIITVLCVERGGGGGDDDDDKQHSFGARLTVMSQTL